jgi:spore coat protein CotF
MEPQTLTTKELGYIEDCIKAEVLCATKAAAFERQVQDDELRAFCRESVQSANRHIDELLTLLA